MHIGKKERIVIASVIFFVFLVLVYKMFARPRIPAMNANLISISREVDFGVPVNLACENSGGGEICPIDLENSKKEIGYAADLGADFIRIDLKKENFEKQGELGKLDNLVAYAREKNLKINLALLGRVWWAGYIDGKTDWENFKKGYAEDADFLAKRYNPNYFLILPECPSKIGRQVNAEITTLQWFNYAKELAFSIRKNAFDAKILLEENFSLAGEEEEYDMEFAKAVMADNDPSIDIISARIESVNDLEKSIQFIEMKNKYHWQGEIWMSNIGMAVSRTEEERKNFLLYAAYLADSRGFGGLVISRLRDGSGVQGGVMRENYGFKGSYEALKKVIKSRR